MTRTDLLKHLKNLLKNEHFERILDVGGTQKTYDFLCKKMGNGTFF